MVRNGMKTDPKYIQIMYIYNIHMYNVYIYIYKIVMNIYIYIEYPNNIFK